MLVPNFSSLLAEALVKVNQSLSSFSHDSQLTEKLILSFGETIEPNYYQQLWANNELNLASVIEIRTQAQLQGANGAFSRDTGKIYLSEDFLITNQNNLDVVVSVILEEYGHLIDAQVNDIETIGDEGQIFSALVKGETLTKTQIEQINGEDDTNTISIDGQNIIIEKNAVQGDFSKSMRENDRTIFGNITVADDSGNPVNVNTLFNNQTLNGNYGQLVFNSSSGTWNYSLNNVYKTTASAFSRDQIVTDTLNLVDKQGTQYNITINVTINTPRIFVRNLNDSGSGSLRDAINTASRNDKDIIDLGNVSGTINLNSSLPSLPAQELEILGDGNDTVNGRDLYRILYSDASRLLISGLTLTNGRHQGASASGNGGGAAGVGGALFVNSGTVILNNIGVTSSSVIGGNGGNSDDNGEGDGGRGGTNLRQDGTDGQGGASGGGGTSGGNKGDGNGSQDGRTGFEGGKGDDGSDFHGGGGGGGGGGGEGATSLTATSGGGGKGGDGGNGGFGAGGGGGGGGGGAGTYGKDGSPGSGGVGGNAGTFGGAGGTAANGGKPGGGNAGHGGGGAGLGGGIFVDNQGTLVLLDNIGFSGNTVTGGLQGNHPNNGFGASNGQAQGSNIFVRQGGQIFAKNNPSGTYLHNTSLQSLATVSVVKTSDTKEGSSGGVFTFSLNKSFSVPLTINYSLTGTANNVSDYTTLGSLTIPSNNTSAILTINPINDNLYEGDETVILTLSSGAYLINGSQNTATMTIDDNEPEVSIISSTPVVMEGNNTASFTINLTEPAPANFEVFYSVGGTTIANSDYNALTGKVLIPQGQTSANVTITLKDDQLYEGDETIEITLINIANDNYGVVSGQETVEITIQENDVIPIATIVKVNDAQEEGQTLGQFKIQLLTPALEGGAQIFYTVTGSATEGSDYNAISRSVTIAKGQTEAFVNITPFDDLIYELGNETVTVSLQEPIVNPDSPNPSHHLGGKNYTIIDSPNTNATLNIVDNDIVPQVSIAVSGNPAEEQESIALFTVTLDNPALAGGVTIPYVVSGTATAGSDFQLLSGSVTISEGSQSATIELTPMDDSIFDSDETVTITLSEPTNNALYSVNNSQKSATVTIQENDRLPFATIVKVSDGSENGLTGQFRIQLDQPAEMGGANVSYVITGSAVNGVDYQTLSGSAFIPEGFDSVLISVNAINDAIVEGTETITISLSDTGNGYNLASSQTSATINLLDNDVAGAIISPVAITTNEQGDDGQFTVKLRSQPIADVTVTINGLDETEGNLSITTLLFTPDNWQSEQIVTVTGVDDNDVDNNQSYSLNLIANSEDINYNNISLGNISITNIDDEGYEVLVIPSNSDTKVTEDGSIDTYQLALTKAPTGNVNVLIEATEQVLVSVDNVNYQNSLTVSLNSIAPKTIYVKAIDDLAIEGSHQATITHTLESSEDSFYDVNNLTIPSLLVEITDNDVPTVNIISTNSASEQNLVGGKVNLALDVPALVGGVNINYTIDNNSTATSGVDYNALSGTVFIPEGESEISIVVTPIQDFLVETGGETVNITLTSGTGYRVGVNSQGTVNIDDNDIAQIRLTETANQTAITEGGAGDTYSIVLTSQPTNDVTIQLNVGNGLITNKNSLTFTATNWQIAQQIIVTAVNDQQVTGNRAGVISHTVSSNDSNYSSLTIPNVNVAITEDDKAGVSLIQTGNITEVSESGITDTYSLVLTSQPSADVTINFNTGNQLSSIEPITFTPANWNQPQSVTVIAQDDFIAQFDRTVTINHNVSSSDPNYQNLVIPSLAVNIKENDIAAIEIIQSDGTTVIEEGGIADFFTIRLTSQPLDDVEISFNLNDDFSADVETLIFTPDNWNEPQIVILEATPDEVTEPRETIPLIITASSNDPTYDNVSLPSLDVEVVNINDRIFTLDEAQILGELFDSILENIDTQLQEQLGVIEVPIIGSVSAVAEELMPFKTALTNQMKQLEGIKINDFISFIRDGLESILPNYLNVKVTGGFAGDGIGLGFRLLVEINLPVWSLPLAVDVGSDSFGLEVDGNMDVGATAILSLGFGVIKTKMVEDLQVAATLGGDYLDKVKPFDPASKILGSLPDPLGKLARKPLNFAKTRQSSFFVDTAMTSFEVKFGAQFSEDFETKGLLGPLIATFKDDKSSKDSKTSAGLNLKVGFQDADIGVGFKFLDANKNGRLDANETVTGTTFLGNAKEAKLPIVASFDLNNNGVYDPHEGNQVILLQTSEIRHNQFAKPVPFFKNALSPLVYQEATIFPQPSVRWFDVNDTGLDEFFEPIGGLLPDGTFDLPYNADYDLNNNGYFDRDDRYEGRGTLYTFVPDYALQYDQHSPKYNPNDPNDSMGFRFLDANGDKIWNNQEPYSTSFGQSFNLPIIDTFDLNGDGKYSESDGEGRIYTLWAIKSKPAILFADNNGDDLFTPVTDMLFYEEGELTPTIVQAPAEPFVNALPDGTFPVIPALDKNGNGKYDLGDGKLLILRDDGSRLSGVEFGNNTALIGNNNSTGKLLLDQFTASASVSANLGLQAQVGLDNLGVGLPNIATEINANYTPFLYEFSDRKGKVINDPTKPKLNLSLNNMRLDLGSWLGKQVQPFAEQADKYIAPFRPVLNALGAEVKLLSTLGLSSAFDINKDGKATVIEMAGTIAKSLAPQDASKIDAQINNFSNILSVVQQVATYIDILAEFKQDSNTGIIINFGSKSYPQQNPNIGTLTTQQVINQLDAKNTTATDKQKGLIGKAKNLLNQSIISPYLFSNIPGLIEGKDVPLLGLQLPPFNLNYNVQKIFSIYGPLTGLLQGSFGASLNLGFGFDTSGINRLARKHKNNTAKPEDYVLLPLDGIYISDRTNADGTGIDKPELTLTATIAAGLGLDVGIASGYLKGGLQGIANLDLIDVGETVGLDDGRIHVSEIVQQAQSGGLFNVFRLYGMVRAFLASEIKVLGSTVYNQNLATFPLFQFDIGPTRNSQGSVSDGYIAGSMIYFDANFNNQLDTTEPFTFTNADGSYDLEIPLILFDLNQNGFIDADEGQIIVEGGIDTSTNLPLTIPMKATIETTVVTPFTTLVAQLSQVDLDRAETLLQEGLGLDTLEVDLLTFNALSALNQTEDSSLQNLGLLVFSSQIQLQSFLIQGTQLIWDNQDDALSLTEIQIVDKLLNAIVSNVKSDSFTLEDPLKVKNLLNHAINQFTWENSEIDITVVEEDLDNFAQAVSDDVTNINNILRDNASSVFDRMSDMGQIIAPLLTSTTVAGTLETIFADLFNRLTRKLVELDKTTEESNDLVKNALGIPQEIDLNTYDPLEQIQQNDPNALELFAKQVQVQTLLTQMSELVQGADISETSQTAGEKVTQAVTDFLQEKGNGALADLTNQNVLEELITKTLPNLENESKTQIAQVIATSNNEINTIVENNNGNNDETLTQIAQIQYVAQNLIAQDLKQVASGDLTPDELVENYSGDSLEEKIDSASEQVNNPIQKTNIENEAPIAENDFFKTYGESITIDVLANDRDPNNDPLEITMFTAPDGLRGTLRLNDNMTVTYTPPKKVFNQDKFFYIVSDGKGGVANGEVTIKFFTNIIGTSANNLIRGTIEDDIINSQNGQDTVYGHSGNDLISGADGHDLIIGNNGDDTLHGNKHNDTLHGNNGNDLINGGVGNDIIRGNNGDDTLQGGDGNDIIHGNNGNDSINGGVGDDLIYFGSGNDTVFGHNGNDTMRASSGNNLIDGGAGDDLIMAGSGADTITGGVGNDFISLTSHSVADVLIYHQGDGNDTVTRFQAHLDKIQFVGISDIFVTQVTSSLINIYDGTDTSGELLTTLMGVKNFTSNNVIGANLNF